MTIPKHKTIVYSAVHTGTWFVCGLLRKTSLQYATVKTDQWLIDTCGYSTEELDFQQGITNSRLDEIIREQDNKGKQLNQKVEFLILQTHQKSNSNLYKELYNRIPKVPVVIPMRDPLLALNTRVWREVGDKQKLDSEPTEYREWRATWIAESIARILELPSNRAYFLPVDINRQPKEQIQIFTDILHYSGVTPNDTLINRATAWKPSNMTATEAKRDRKSKRIDNDIFIEIKNDILNNKMKAANRYLDIEVAITRKILLPYISRLQEMGYKEMCWW